MCFLHIPLKIKNNDTVFSCYGNRIIIGPVLRIRIIRRSVPVILRSNEPTSVKGLGPGPFSLFSVRKDNSFKSLCRGFFMRNKLL
jgi:hypothetical protein